jgi:6-methylsalicylate decarboxylase
MPHIDASIAELGRALDELHMAGVAMNTTVLGHALVEPRYEPVFAELDRRAAVLYLHPAGNRRRSTEMAMFRGVCLVRGRFAAR